MFTRFRSMPATALAAVLGCALMATAAVPAAAQDKPKKETKGKKDEEAAKGGITITPSKAFGPAVKKIHPGVTLVMVDVARPCTFTDSSGWCGPEQRKKLEAILSDASLAKEYVVVALHYGLLRAGGERDKPTHRIRDDVELMAVLDAPHAHCDLVLHGHMHRPFSVRTARRLVFGAGSATDLHLACGYNVYDVDLERRSVVVNRRVWDEQRATYQAAQQPPPV